MNVITCALDKWWANKPPNVNNNNPNNTITTSNDDQRESHDRANSPNDGQLRVSSASKPLHGHEKKEEELTTTAYGPEPTCLPPVPQASANDKCLPTSTSNQCPQPVPTSAPTQALRLLPHHFGEHKTTNDILQSLLGPHAFENPFEQYSDPDCYTNESEDDPYAIIELPDEEESDSEHSNEFAEHNVIYRTIQQIRDRTTCTECLKKIPKDSQHCHGCGTPVGQSISRIIETTPFPTWPPTMPSNKDNESSTAASLRKAPVASQSCTIAPNAIPVQPIVMPAHDKKKGNALQQAESLPPAPATSDNQSQAVSPEAPGSPVETPAESQASHDWYNQSTAPPPIQPLPTTSAYGPVPT
jgi:hypothetical protein